MLNPQRRDRLKLALLGLGLGIWGAYGVFAGTALAAQDPIRIGNTNPYSGPASAWGSAGKAMTAYFNMLNDQGGIQGRKIEFISLDDGYSPAKTVELTRRLVEQERVLLMFGALGTATNLAVQNYLNDRKVPQLFVQSGASRWNNPKQFPWTMGWSPSYVSEGRIYAKAILSEQPQGRIAVLYQNDDFGKDYLNGLREGLGSQASRIVAQASYEPTDATVDSQVIVLRASGADVLVNFAAPKFAAQTIRRIAEMGWRPVHYLNVTSNSIKSVLEVAGLEHSKGLISAAYYKDPSDPRWQSSPELKSYRDFMSRYMPQADINDVFHVAGYSNAQTLEHVLRQSVPDLSRSNIMRQAASIRSLSLPMLLPGVTVSTSEQDFAPIQAMQLQRFDGQRWHLFGSIYGR
jgi:branched-chain amino acid transport system substrate-binding protein